MVHAMQGQKEKGPRWRFKGDFRFPGSGDMRLDGDGNTRVIAFQYQFDCDIITVRALIRHILVSDICNQPPCCWNSMVDYGYIGR